MKLMRELRGFFGGLGASFSPETNVKDGAHGGTKPVNIADMISGNTTGFAIERNGVLQVQTVADTRDGAMICGLILAGNIVTSFCDKKGCDCFEKSFKKAIPDARVVEVDVMVRD